LPTVDEGFTQSSTPKLSVSEGISPVVPCVPSMKNHMASELPARLAAVAATPLL
jgi:hypothetical protein